MYLAEAKQLAVEGTEAPENTSCTTQWHHWPASTISHHGQVCCDIAREWIVGIDNSQLGDGAAITGPRWLRHKYPWGPSRWPLHWCEAVELEQLDCGAHAAIAQELFAARGVTSFPAQFVQQFSTEATGHWTQKWEEEQITAAWIQGDLIYHEGCAVALGDGEIKLWDASAGWWINPRQLGGYGGLRSVRIFAPQGDTFLWGDRQIVADVWGHMG
jgi:hypothetical protein